MEKIQSDPHGDMGSWAEMTQPALNQIDQFIDQVGVSNKVPKVGKPLGRQRGAAPHIGDDMVSSRLYAGRPGVSRRYGPVGPTVTSDL
jgi:hypothetical protein